MAKEKIVDAVVTAPTFINGVLHLPGDAARVHLGALGVTALGAGTPGLRAPAAGETVVAPPPVPVLSAQPPHPAAPAGVPPGIVVAGPGGGVTLDLAS